MIVFLSTLVGFSSGSTCGSARPAFFKGKTLTRATPTLVPDE